MTSRHLVDAELAPLLELFAATLDGPLAEKRANAARMQALRPPSAFEDVTVEEKRVPGAPGDPPVRILTYRPNGAEGMLPAYLHIHGGGYILGNADMSDDRCRSVAQQLRCLVVSVDYRLAPETPFPGPVEDCYAALTWLYDHAGELGVDAARIAIGGESAGGGLAATLALLARDRGKVPVAFQLLIYPMLDDRTAATDDPHPWAGEFVWTRESNHFGWSSLLACAPGAADVSAYAAAARAESLAGLPPTFISVGALDLFIEEDLEYARRLMRAGVPTELHVYPGAYHAFNMAQGARLADMFERDLMAALRAALQGGGGQAALQAR